MKKILFFILILLTSCRVFSNKTPVTMEVFTQNGQCPYVCWLGINPGATTMSEAKAALNSSDQIKEGSTQIYGTSTIDTVWYDDEAKSTLSRVSIEFHDEVVSTIFFNKFPFLVGDFTKLLGEPTQISINVQKAEADFVHYALYFPQQKSLLYVSPAATRKGPEPADSIWTLTLNTEINKNTLPQSWENFQPWLGFGHLKAYLKGQELP